MYWGFGNISKIELDSGVDKQGLEFQKKLLCQRQKFLKLGEKN
jgi:hypothetical protein